MTKMKRYECPECKGQFDYLHHPSVEDDPVRFCPLCGFDTMGDNAAQMEAQLGSPMLRSNLGKSTENVYRAMEEGAAFRAEVAKEKYGADQAEANLLKITDMQESRREGDIAAAPIRNSVAQAMAAAPPGMTGFAGNAHVQQAVQYARGTSQGPEPHAGLRAQQALRQKHSAMSGGRLTSELPSLEVYNRGGR